MDRISFCLLNYFAINHLFSSVINSFNTLTRPPFPSSLLCSFTSSVFAAVVGSSAVLAFSTTSVKNTGADMSSAGAGIGVSSTTVGTDVSTTGLGAGAEAGVSSTFAGAGASALEAGTGVSSTEAWAGVSSTGAG